MMRAATSKSALLTWAMIAMAGVSEYPGGPALAQVQPQPQGSTQTQNLQPQEIAIRAAISKQLDAMNKGDDAAAFAIASPVIQQMFVDPRTFMSMVERSYPQVFKSRGTRFLALSATDGRLLQRVVIESDAGTVIGNYEMIEIDGIWRINGCSFEKRDDA